MISGLVIVSILAVLVACRPSHKKVEDESGGGDECSQVSPGLVDGCHESDTEALQPSGKDKKLYRPSESRA